MRREKIVYQPDWIDVETQLSAIAEDFGALCTFVLTIERQRVHIRARCDKIVRKDADPPLVVAMASRPVNSVPNVAVMAFAVAQDCYRQLDTGTLGVAQKPLAHEWSGRPQVLRRRRA